MADSKPEPAGPGVKGLAGGSGALGCAQKQRTAEIYQFANSSIIEARRAPWV